MCVGRMTTRPDQFGETKNDPKVSVTAPLAKSKAPPITASRKPVVQAFAKQVERLIAINAIIFAQFFLTMVHPFLFLEYDTKIVCCPSATVERLPQNEI